MRLLIAIAFICVFSMGCGTLAQQQYRSHTVQQGETVYSIARVYGLSTEAIYKLNPEAREGISANSILVIPTADVINAEQIPVKFKKHRVKRKETLFSIAQYYDVSVDDIKRYNKHLYSKQLRKGEKLQIPILPAANSVVTTTESGTNSEGKKHTVQAKETKYGIARMYGITIPELEELNPEMGENLQVGAVLNVPDIEVTETATIEEDKYDFYVVQPKEGFFRLKVKLGLTREEIVALNPYAAEGLKDGMVLKIPKESADALAESAMLVNLEDRIDNKDEKRLVVMLPFLLNRVDRDSLNAKEEILKKERTLRIALDFYSGVLMAAEFAKDKGISVNVRVFDTEASERKVGSIVNATDFDNVDAVIGPLLQKNIERVASELRSSDTPVFSPLSNREIKLYSNVFQTIPTDNMLQEAMLKFLKRRHQGENTVLISDAGRSAAKNAIMSVIPSAKAVSPREGGFLYVVDLEQKLIKNQENWVILESGDPVLVSNVVGLLNGMPPEYQISLFTLDKNDAYDYDDVSNMHLANLNFTFPSINKSYDHADKNPFLVSYKNKYGVLPNRYAVRGFDITYDVLLRLASADDIYDATNSDFETEYIENKFRYTKKLFAGYQNKAFYIIKYNEELQFEVVE